MVDSPSAYWRLGESSGNPQDSVGTAHVTGVVGTPTYGVAGALSGDMSTAVTFAGGSEFTIPNNAALNFGDGPFSVEVWAKRDQLTGTGIMALVARGLDGWCVGFNNTDQFFLSKQQTAQIARESGSSLV